MIWAGTNATGATPALREMPAMACEVAQSHVGSGKPLTQPMRVTDAKIGNEPPSALSVVQVESLLANCAARLVLCLDACAGATDRWTFLGFSTRDAGASNRLIVADLYDAAEQGFLDGRYFASAIHHLVIDAWPHTAGGDHRYGSYWLTPEMEEILDSIALPAADIAQATRRQAKLQELTCLALTSWRSGELLPGISTASVSIAERRRLASAHGLIQARFAEKLTIDDVGRRCGVSRAKLTAGFRKVFGKSVAEVLVERRMSAASLALRSTHLPISQIAFDCGYASQAAFSRAFSRRYTLTPSLYRSLQSTPAVNRRRP